jgi:excisionase family DNA binding protein
MSVTLELPDSALDALAEAIAERVATTVEGLIDAGSPWMTTEEAIEYTRIPPGTFRQRVAAGEIPSHGGRTHIFHRDEVDRALGYVPRQGHVAPLRRTSAA